MKTVIYLGLNIIAALTIHAQGSIEAMQSYVNASDNLDTIYTRIASANPMTLGWTFQPQTDINVTALGAFDDVVYNPGNLEIGIWDSSGNLLTSSLVALTGTSSGSVYQSVTPTMLTAGQTYYLGAYSASQTLYFYVVGPDSDTHGYAVMSPEIQLGQLAYNTSTTFAFPSTIDGQPGDAVVIPNFKFSAVPEPSTFYLLSGGVMALLVCQKRRTSQLQPKAKKLISPTTDV